MQISLRSQLIAGSTAVIGASAIAMTPVTSAHLSLPALQAPASAVQTALVAFSSPLAQLSQTLIQTSTYLLNGDANPLAATSWAFSGFPGSGSGSQGGLPVLPAGLALPEAGGYSSVGLLPQIIDDALPIISQLGYNGSEYLNATFTSLGLAGVQLGNGVIGAIEDLLSLDITGAIESLVTAVSQVGSTLLNAGGFVLTGVVNRLTAVVETTVELVPLLLGSTLNQLGAVAASVGAVVTNFVDAFSSGTPIESAWNALVDGLLGPSGIPGTLNNLTIGAGVQTGPITTLDQSDIEANFAPSIRTVVQGGVKAIAGALATPVVAAAAAEAPAAAAAAEVADVEVPAAVEAAEVEAPAAVAEAPAPAAVAEVEAPAAVEVAEVEVPAAVEVAEVEAPAAATAPKAAASENARAAKGTPKRAHRGAAARAATASAE